MKIGLGIIFASMLLVVVEGFVSYYLSHNFWPSQVMARWGKAGISFFAHGGMWGDLFLLPALMAVIVVNYVDKWTAEQVIIMAVVGVAVTLGNHLMLIFTQETPDPLGWKQEKWSALIALHFVYMSTYVALAGLFFCYTPGVSVTAAVWVALILGIHMAFGTHVPLGMLNRFERWEWCPDFLSSPVLPYLSAVIWLALSALAWIATKEWHAGLIVGGIGSGLGLAVLVFSLTFPPTKIYG